MKSLNSKGSAHLIIPAIVIVLVAAIGTYLLTKSHADTLTSVSGVYTGTDVKLNTLNPSATLDRGNQGLLMMQRDHSGYTQGMIYGAGVTLTSLHATSYSLYPTKPAQGIGFYESSGGITPGQKVQLHLYANPTSLTDGTYTGSYILKYTVAGSSKTMTGPTINYAIKLVTSPYSKYLTINGSYVTATLSRSKAQGGLVYGPGITLTGVQLTTYSLYPIQPAQGKGFYDSSGGLAPGQSFTARTYLNANLPNGTYTGNYALQYLDTGDIMQVGPTVTYKLTLTN